MDVLQGEKILNYNAMDESQVIDLIPSKQGLWTYVPDPLCYSV